MEVITALNAFNVRWNNHHRTFMNVLERVFEDETYSDCSLAAEGQEISTHKLILSACSPFLNSVLQKHRERHPIIVLRDVSFEDLKLVVEYIYKGEVSVSQEGLTSFLTAAEMLQVTGLQDVYHENAKNRRDSISQTTGPRKKIKSESDCDALSTGSIEFLSDEIDAKSDNILLVVDDFQDVDQTNEKPGQDDIRADLENLLVSQSVVQSIKPIKLESKETKSSGNVQINRCRVVKSDEYNITCSKCKGIYKNETSFINHQRYDCNQIHECEVCMKTFKNKRHLLDHRRDDCGRVHVCLNCNRQFKQKVNLTTHQKHYCKSYKSAYYGGISLPTPDSRA